MSSNHVIYEKEYLPFIIKWGRITNWTALVLCFSPALVLAVGFGLMPPFSAILSGFLAITSAVGVIWFVEPISYFPIVGVAGTYMAFVSGNISNLRIPCAMIAQKAAGVEPETDRGSIVATLGMAVSIIVNVIILALYLLLAIGVRKGIIPGFASMLIAVFASIAIFFYKKNIIK